MSRGASSAEIAAGDVEAPARKPRGARRRPDLPAPKLERIRPRSGMSRAEVVADQRRRLLAGIAAAVAYHGYEDTRITDIVELAGVSRPTFYEHFEGKDDCFAAAYADGVERLAGAVEAAVGGLADPVEALATGLNAGLELLATEPALAHLLLVESLAAARPARLEHERTLGRLANALRQASIGPAGEGALPPETARLLAGGVASHLAGRILAGETEELPASRDLLLGYLLASLPASSRPLARSAAGG
jgi:AcrR family transcriptional regulator